MQINNKYLVEECPLCGDKGIFYFDYIKYTHPVYFANTEIELTQQPQLWGCKACGSRFTQNILSEDDANKLYAQSTDRWNYQIPFEKFHTKNVVDIITKLCKPGMRILDIGCSNGKLLDFAKTLGCITYGIEFSDSGRNECIKKGHYCYEDPLELSQEILFDRIFCFDVIEHVHTPKQFLNLYAHLLSRGGILCIITGDIQGYPSTKYGSGWWYVQYPEHIRFPSLGYFKKSKQFRVVDSVKCYSSKNHEGITLHKCMELFRRIINYNLNGNPSFTPDHICILLEKTGA